MNCCPAARRQAITQIRKNMPGQDGFVLIEYRGNQAIKRLQSRTTEAIYIFTPGARKYIDAYDAGMFDLELEDGEIVFFEIWE